MDLKLAIFVASLVALAYGSGCKTKFPPGVKRHKDGKETDEMKVNYTDTVVFGAVKEIMESTIQGVKDIKLEVVCSYKGGVDKKYIWITGLGNEHKEIPDCPKASAKKVNTSAIFFLKKLPARNDQSWYQIEFAPNHGGASYILDELTFVCGLNLTYLGELKENPNVCYNPLPPGDCLPYKLPNTTTTSTTTTTTMAPKPDTTKTGTTNVVGPPKNPDDLDKGNGNGYKTKTDKPSGEVAEGSKGDDGNRSNYTSASAILVILFSIIATLV